MEPLNYIDRLASAIGTHCGLSMGAPRERQLLRLYALLGYTLKMHVSRDDVHDAWSVWRSEDKPDHPALVPFDELSEEVQGKDEPYRVAILHGLYDLDMLDAETLAVALVIGGESHVIIAGGAIWGSAEDDEN